MGISLPREAGQEEVMRKAYAKAGIETFSDTDYIECHGTGTPVGDPIEVEGVSRVFKRDLNKGPILIGSVRLQCITMTSLRKTYNISGKDKPRT